MAGISIYVDGQLCHSFANSRDTSVLQNALRNLPERIDVTCTAPLTGRVVKIQKDGVDRGIYFNFINICEVQNWGKYQHF